MRYFIVIILAFATVAKSVPMDTVTDGSSLYYGLVAHWCLNESTGTNTSNLAINSTQNGYLTNAFTRAAGLAGNALTFPSPTNVGFNVLCPTNTVSGFPFTLSATFKTSYPNISSAFIYSTANTTNDGEYYALSLSAGSGCPRMAVSSTVATSATTNNVTLTNGAWHQIVGVFYQTNHLALYVDGSFGASNNIINAGTVFPSVNNTTIGALRRTTTSLPFSGQIDECNTWNRALTPNEIKTLWSGFQ